MIHPMDAYTKAADEANRAVPNYKYDTPEHQRWLEVFDKAYARIVLREDSIWENDHEMSAAKAHVTVGLTGTQPNQG